MILIYLMILGISIGLTFLAYTRYVRSSNQPSVQSHEVSSMVGGRVNRVTTGAVPKSMPTRLMSESEREEE